MASKTLYYLMQVYDPEFAELFKVAANFEEVIECSDDNITHFGEYAAGRR